MLGPVSMCSSPATPTVARSSALNLLAKLFNQGFVSGLYRVGAMQLYVSRGTGLWGGFPIRSRRTVRDHRDRAQGGARRPDSSRAAVKGAPGFSSARDS